MRNKVPHAVARGISLDVDLSLVPRPALIPHNSLVPGYDARDLPIAYSSLGCHVYVPTSTYV